MRKFFAFVCTGTLAMLVYVYAEVAAVKTGYDIRKQEESKSLLTDRARALEYNISRMKAPGTLERKLEARKIVLESPKTWQTLVMPGSRPVRPVAAEPMLARTPFFTKFLIGTAQAEAKETVD